MNSLAALGGALWNRRWRPILISLLAVAALWVLALVGYSFAKNSRVTAEKVRQYAESVDLRKLSGAARAQAIRKLEAMLNALSIEERQKARFQRLAWSWLDEMTEEEKAGFIEATMPTGFKQMLAAFEQLPEEKRRKTVDDAIRRLRETQARLQAGSNEEEQPSGTNAPPVLSDELQAQIRTLG